MTTSRRGMVGVAVALIAAIVLGGILSRSLLHSGATRSRSTESDVVTLFNQIRARRGLPALSIDPKLGQAADAHSADMIRKGYFAHDDSREAWDVRIQRYVKRHEVGEILAFGSGTFATPSGMVSAWMHSPEHRRVILTPELRRVGLGLATGTYDGTSGVTMSTADFSTAT